MSTERGRFPTYAEMQSPLYLHPSDGPNTLALSEKLIGAANYRAWRRGMEINLSTKRKLGFFKGTIPKPVDDLQKIDQWETCNSMVIAWIVNSVSESIAKSILYVENAYEIWMQLEKRFALSNGSRKYKLNKEIYAMKQAGKKINEHYTQMKSLWEELDAMEVLLRLGVVNAEMAEYLKCIEKQKEEQRLFQFLNNLDDCYNSQRSQLLLMPILPSVEEACAMLQQEESQREVLDVVDMNNASAMYSKKEYVQQNKNEEKCGVCGGKWHPREKCWAVIGYPSWHSKSKKFPQKQAYSTSGNRSISGRGKGKENSEHRVVAQAEVTDGNVTFSQRQFEDLMKRLAGAQTDGKAHDTDDDLEDNFAGLCKQEDFGNW